MDAKQTVLDMYTKLKAEVNFDVDITVDKVIDFDGFYIVVCESSLERFGLIVLPEGKVLNDEGDDVYEMIKMHNTFVPNSNDWEARVMIESEGGTSKIFFEGTKEEADAIQAQYDGHYTDENEFDWSMYVIENKEALK